MESREPTKQKEMAEEEEGDKREEEERRKRRRKRPNAGYGDTCGQKGAIFS